MALLLSVKLCVLVVGGPFVAQIKHGGWSRSALFGVMERHDGCGQDILCIYTEYVSHVSASSLKESAPSDTVEAHCLAVMLAGVSTLQEGPLRIDRRVTSVIGPPSTSPASAEREDARRQSSSGGAAVHLSLSWRASPAVVLEAVEEQSRRRRHHHLLLLLKAQPPPLHRQCSSAGQAPHTMRPAGPPTFVLPHHHHSPRAPSAVV